MALKVGRYIRDGLMLIVPIVKTLLIMVGLTFVVATIHVSDVNTIG
jgi:hypothetical protein